jgi:hypothetical protein
MDFDANVLLASIVPSSIGLVLVMYGKRQSRAPHVIIGILLMIYPYLISNIWLMFAIAGVLCLALWGAVRAGM